MSISIALGQCKKYSVILYVHQHRPGTVQEIQCNYVHQHRPGTVQEIQCNYVHQQGSETVQEIQYNSACSTISL